MKNEINTESNLGIHDQNLLDQAIRLEAISSEELIDWRALFQSNAEASRQVMSAMIYDIRVKKGLISVDMKMNALSGKHTKSADSVRQI